MDSLEQVHSNESLKELVKKLKLDVPDRYIQDHLEPTVISYDSSPLPSIPVIDMNDLIKNLGSDGDQLKKLRSVCHEWGIFQLVNHGVDKLLVENMKKEMVKFFKLPEEEKLRYKMKADEHEGYGQTIYAQDEKVDWSDRLYMITNPLHRRKSHLLPNFPPSIRDTMETYLQELQNLAMTLLGLIGQAVDIDKREMLDVFEDGMQSVRMTYYPPCPQPDLVVGLTPHSDGSAITILLQVNDTEGLQVKKDGTWIPVNFLPDAFIVNVGDALEVMSNGVYNSIEHRVMVNAIKERISLAMFFNPKLDADVGPAKSILKNTGHPPLYRTLAMEQYHKEFYSGKAQWKDISRENEDRKWRKLWNLIKYNPSHVFSILDK